MTFGKVFSTITTALAAGILVAGCQSFGVEVTREVTREVTVVVTDGAAVAQAVESATSAATASATPSPSPTRRGTATPRISATPDLFPTPSVGQVYVADQKFQNGRMFWIEPVDQIWVALYDDNGDAVWQVYDDTFEEGMIESDPSFVAPEELFQPTRGFGKLWRENTPLRNRLGWATETEIGYITTYEYHARGTVSDNNDFLDEPGYHLVKTEAGETFEFDEADWQWEVIRIEPTATP